MPNPKGRAATGAPVYAYCGTRVTKPRSDSQKVLEKKAIAAATAARKANPSASAFTYVARLQDGKRYVGYSRNPEQRLRQHIAGTGAQVTREHKLRSVSITPYKSVAAAKRAETKQYFEQKKKFGGANVRGAGNTVRFSKTGEPLDKPWRK